METATKKIELSEYVAYEYASVNVSKTLAELYIDSYKSFGWKLIESREGLDGANIKFKRDREIENRKELQDCQKKFNEEIANIENLTVQKTRMANLASIITGFVGTAFMAGATFAYLAPTPMIALMIPLAIVGFVGWIAPYFMYKAIKKKQSLKVEAPIEQSFENIYEICSRARKLWV